MIPTFKIGCRLLGLLGIPVGLMLTLSGWAQVDSRNPQYGLAHRVNDAQEIVSALAAGANGIEFDAYFYGENWYACHDNPNLPHDTVAAWLYTLKFCLDTHLFDRSFAALYVDVKTPNEGYLQAVVFWIHQFMPNTVQVIYGLNGLENFESNILGLMNIKDLLLPNEGISGWASSVEEVGRFYSAFQKYGITRGMVDHGDAGLGAHRDILIEMNQPRYHRINDPYRFKKVLVWTQPESSLVGYNPLGGRFDMAEYLNPEAPWHMDAQMVGDPWAYWNRGGFGDFTVYITKFTNTVAKFPTERMADRTDNFWGEGSASDWSLPEVYVDRGFAGGLIGVGTQSYPYVSVAEGLEAVQAGGTVWLAPFTPPYPAPFTQPNTYVVGGGRLAAPKGATLRRWGNSGTVRLTRGIAEDIGGSPVEYLVSVQTSGDVAGAGTDSNVAFIFEGSRASSWPFAVNPLISRNAFETGQADYFFIELPALGKLKSVTISKDNAGSGPDWHLSYIAVMPMDGHPLQYALWNQWIRAGYQYTISFNQ